MSGIVNIDYSIAVTGIGILVYQYATGIGVCVYIYIRIKRI